MRNLVVLVGVMAAGCGSKGIHASGTLDSAVGVGGWVGNPDMGSNSGTGGAGLGGSMGKDAPVASGGISGTDGPIATGGIAVPDAPVATGGFGLGGTPIIKGTGGTIGVDAGTTVSPGSLSFSATPAVIAPGQSSTLSWAEHKATSLSIDQGIGSVLGKTSVVVTPNQTTNYILTLNDILRDQVTVTVTNTTSSPKGSLITARTKHTATLLADGKVLITGGTGNGNALASAELYDPDTGTFTATGNMTLARSGHTATLMASGKVLIVSSTSAELYDPTSGAFTATGNPTVSRNEHTATSLQNGKVLIAGGRSSSDGLTSSELYDPATGNFTASGNLTVARYHHSATLLKSGMVLVVGGDASPTGIGSDVGLDSAELYDPSTAIFAATGSMRNRRAFSAATLLSDGTVLVAGGPRGMGGYTLSTGLEIYDAATGQFSSTGNLLTARVSFSMTLLPSGQVLIAGGSGGGDAYGKYFASTELYDPAARTCTASANMTAEREFHSATALPDGTVLIAGGDRGSPLASAELYR
jgi:uncharacterized protein (DUF2147 family)